MQDLILLIKINVFIPVSLPYMNPSYKPIVITVESQTNASPVYCVRLYCLVVVLLQLLFLLLREEVSVGTAVLQGHAVASGAQTVSCHSQSAVVVSQRRVFHHRHVPQEGVGSLLHLGHLERETVTQV